MTPCVPDALIRRRGQRILRHGTEPGYTAGCRGEHCRAAHASAAAARKAADGGAMVRRTIARRTWVHNALRDQYPEIYGELVAQARKAVP